VVGALGTVSYSQSHFVMHNCTSTCDAEIPNMLLAAPRHVTVANARLVSEQAGWT